jgi:NADH:ubiquinone oxidoreductase subunit 2 (subunit N)
MYTWWRFVHVVGAFGFLAAHGATAAVAMRLRKERDPAKIRALLGLSRSTRPWMYVSLLLLIAAGVIAGFQGHWWDQGWIWTALILLIVLLVVAFPLAVPYYVRVRRAVAEGSDTRPEELASLLLSPRPIVIAAVETAGLVVIVWLMVLKPF